MNRKIAKICAVALVAGSLAGCQSGASSGETAGTLLGAAAGGLLGSQIGSGSGKLAAVAIGVLGGAYLGGQLGKYLTEEDQQQAYSTAQQSFEYQPSGTTSSWSNPDSGNSGTVTPTRTYQATDGNYCREYQSTVTIDGRTEYVTGTACRNQDGTWRFVN